MIFPTIRNFVFLFTSTVIITSNITMYIIDNEQIRPLKLDNNNDI